MDAQLEQGPASDDLERWQHDPGHIHMGDQDVAGDLSDVLQEAEVQIFILQPCQFEVAVDIGAIRVSIP